MGDRILIVDDEIEIADLIEVYLNSENYTVFKFYLHVLIQQSLISLF